MKKAPHEFAKRAEIMLDDLKRAGLKMTPQRLAIVKLFASDENHPTAQDLFDRLKHTFPTMSFATVYNTLDALASAGLSGVIRLGGAARFDPNMTAHHHAVCDACSRVSDIPAPSLAPSASATRSLEGIAPGFSIRSVEQIYRGLCANCLERETKKPARAISHKAAHRS
jgi:Fe2+ or Zn2+ uptake regulation protein